MGQLRCAGARVDPVSRPRGLGSCEFIIDLRPHLSRPTELAEVGRIFRDAGVAALVGDHVDEPDAGA